MNTNTLPASVRGVELSKSVGGQLGIANAIKGGS
jgi:hypothetical protein